MGAYSTASYPSDIAFLDPLRFDQLFRNVLACRIGFGRAARAGERGLAFDQQIGRHMLDRLDREVIDLMLAHIPMNKVEGAYNRAAYMPRRRELACIWATILMPGLAEPGSLTQLRFAGAGTSARVRKTPLGGCSQVERGALAHCFA